jgi:hypothetical protein
MGSFYPGSDPWKTPETDLPAANSATPTVAQFGTARGIASNISVNQVP